MSEVVTQDGEIIETGTSLAMLDTRLVSELAKAEIDQQIATAHKFPRSVKRSIHNIMSLATLDEDAAADCIYALPRGGKPIRGPSIRLAEIISGQWGNCRVAARVVDVNRTEKYVEAEGVFHDLETNMATKATVRVRIVDKSGRLYNDDMIIVTGNAACSKARRNAILAGVPKAVWNKAYVGAEQIIKGDLKTLSERRASAISAFGTWGVKPEQIYAALGVAGEEEITLEHIPTLKGMYAAIKNGEETVETTFGNRGPAESKNFTKVENPLKDETPADAAAPGSPSPADQAPAGADAAPNAAPAAGEAPNASPAPSSPTPEQPDGIAPPASTSGSGPDGAAAGAAPSGSPRIRGATAAEAHADKFPPEQIAAARDRGAKAFAAGMLRTKALPKEYRDAPALSAAWFDGFDTAQAEAAAAPGQEA